MEKTALTAESLVRVLNDAGMRGELKSIVRLSGGANKESWKFTLQQSEGLRAYVLRRNAGNSAAISNQASPFTPPDIHVEAELIRYLQGHNLKLPNVVAEFSDSSELGPGFVMTFEAGESLPKRILTDPSLAKTRTRLAADCGDQLARLHGVKLNPELEDKLDVDIDLNDRLQKMQSASKELGNTSPIHALAHQWLASNIPTLSRRCLVHGDFRLGNIVVDDQGLTSILDWELARISFAEEDLGYLTANIWRFAQPQNPVGGFGHYEQLLDSYEARAGWRPSLAAIKFWQFFTAVSWGTICLVMRNLYQSGHDSSLERVAVSRRFAESEVDILLLLEELE